MSKRRKGESGQILPITLAVLMLGAMIVTPFITQAGNGILASREYGQIMMEGYACDAAVEQAIWRLTNQGLGAQIPNVGDSLQYELAHEVNGITPQVSVTTEQSGGVPGSIADTIRDTFEFDPSTCYTPDFLNVSEGIYAVAYRGPGSDGFITTVSVEADGQITGLIDSLEFDTSSGYEPRLIQVADEVLAVVYRGSGNDGFIKTIPVTLAGDIGTEISSFEFDTSDCYTPDVLMISDGIYAVAYEGNRGDGFIKTVSIAPDGQISGIIDTLEFDPSDGYEPSLVNVADGVVAVAYRGSGSNGFLSTITIAADGNIGSVIDTLEFDTASCYTPSMVTVAPGIYAVAYNGSGSDGFLCTISVDTGGNIGGVIQTFEFDGNTCYEPDLAYITDDVYGIVYRGPSNTGVMATVTVYENGQILEEVIDTLEFDTTCYEPEIVSISGGMYAIAYRGQGNDGFITTIEISSFSLYTVQSISGSSTVTALVKITESHRTSVLSWVPGRN